MLFRSTLGLSILIGIPLGIMAAINQGKWKDNFCMGFALLGVSIPDFWLALLLIILFSVKLGWLPAMGIGGVKYYILPALAGCMGGIATLARQTRSSMLDVIRADYITTARAKGGDSSHASCQCRKNIVFNSANSHSGQPPQFYGKQDNQQKMCIRDRSSYNGEELELLCMSDSTTQRVAQMIQNYLLAINVKLKLNIVDSALFSASRFDGAQYDMIIISAGAGSLPAFWSNRFDSTAYEKGDGTARRDEVLTEMLYSTWSNSGFTEENIDAVHRYIKDHVYAYGICLPTISTIYSSKIVLTESVNLPSGNIDFVASVKQ